tara:strand:- start:4174 stop:4443 length:270 start_codon:yes stop_codon:yes gene_type:complete
MTVALSIEPFWVSLGVGLGVMVISARVSLRLRRSRKVEEKAQILDDQAVDRIIRQGKLSINEDVLDLDAIDDEEERFWSETWDEPEEAW